MHNNNVAGNPCLCKSSSSFVTNSNLNGPLDVYSNSDGIYISDAKNSLQSDINKSLSSNEWSQEMSYNRAKTGSFLQQVRILLSLL